jgi:hypothetical protein
MSSLNTPDPTVKSRTIPFAKPADRSRQAYHRALARELGDPHNLGLATYVAHLEDQIEGLQHELIAVRRTLIDLTSAQERVW